jgi:hypothetical protein
MATIGGMTVTIVEGQLFAAPTAFRLFTRGGINGTGVLFGQYHDVVIPIKTYAFFDTYANASTAAGQYRAFMATQQTVVDQFGATISNVAVCSVIVTIYNVILPSTPWLLQADWQLMPETA